MAGLSPTPRAIRSKETSPSPSALLTQRLTPRLPPIVTEGAAKAPCPPPPSPAPWSWYHRNCHSPRPHHPPSSRRRQNPKKSTRTQKDPDETSIRMYLDANPGFLAEYIADEVTARDLEDWLHMKRRVDGTSPDSAHSYVVTSCASSNKFKTCTGYTAREHGSSSSSVEEEDVPSVIMMSVHQEKKRHSFVVLNEKQLMSKLYPFRSSSDDLSALDFQKEKPRTVDSTTMTSPPPRPKGKPGQSHSNGLLQPVYPDHRMDSSSLSDSFSSAISNGSPEVHSTNGLHQTRSNSNGLYSHGFRHAVSMNGHQANGHNLSNRNYKRQSSVNGHMHSNEPSRVLSANGSPRKPRRVLPVSASKTIRNMTV